MSGATSFTSVPIVDISGRRSQDRAERERVAGGIGNTLFERVLASTKELFALPLEEKMRVLHRAVPVPSRLRPVGEEGVESGTPDLKEAFDTAPDLPADDPDYLAGNPMLGPNTWPDLPGCADVVTAYYHAVLDVGHRMLWAFAVARVRTRTPARSTRPRGRARCGWCTTHTTPTPRTARASARTPCLRGNQPPGVQGERGTVLVPAVLQRRLPHRGETVAAVCFSRRQAAAGTTRG